MQHLTLCRVPERDEAAGISSRQKTTVWAVGNLDDRTCVWRWQLSDLRARGGVPQQETLVKASRGKRAAIRADGNGAGAIRMSFEQFASRQIPPNQTAAGCP